MSLQTTAEYSVETVQTQHSTVVRSRTKTNKSIHEK